MMVAKNNVLKYWIDHVGTVAFLAVLTIFLVSLAFYTAHAQTQNIYYFIIEKEEHPAGGSISFPYHWMWYECNREPSTNTLGVPIKLETKDFDGIKKALQPYLTINNIQDLKIYYEDGYCWKLKGYSIVETSTSPPPPTFSRTSSTTTSVGENIETTPWTQNLLFIIVVAAVILLILVK